MRERVRVCFYLVPLKRLPHHPPPFLEPLLLLLLLCWETEIHQKRVEVPDCGLILLLLIIRMRERERESKNTFRCSLVFCFVVGEEAVLVAIRSFVFFHTVDNLDATKLLNEAVVIGRPWSLFVLFFRAAIQDFDAFHGHWRPEEVIAQAFTETLCDSLLFARAKIVVAADVLRHCSTVRIQHVVSDITRTFHPRQESHARACNSQRTPASDFIYRQIESEHVL